MSAEPPRSPGIDEAREQPQMPGVAKFAASVAALASQEPADAGTCEVGDDSASLRPEEMRPLTLHFASSSVDFETSVPRKAASGDELTVVQLRDILLNRGLLSCAEHVAFFDTAPAAAGGGTAPSNPLDAGHRISSDAIWVLQATWDASIDAGARPA